MKRLSLVTLLVVLCATLALSACGKKEDVPAYNVLFVSGEDVSFVRFVVEYRPCGSEIEGKSFRGITSFSVWRSDENSVWIEAWADEPLDEPRTLMVLYGASQMWFRENTLELYNSANERVEGKLVLEEVE